MPDHSPADDIQRALADLLAGRLDAERNAAVLQSPQAVAPLLRALDATTADVIVLQLARIAARILADPQHAGAPPQDAQMAVSHALSTLVAMAGGALPLRQESLVAAFRALGDIGVAILERRLLEAPPDQANRIQTLLADLRRAPEPAAQPPTDVEPHTAAHIPQAPLSHTVGEGPGVGASPVDDLIHTLTADPDPAARRDAAQALANLGPAALPAIHQRLDAEIRAAHQDPAAEARAGTRADLVLAAARIDHSAALEPLLQALLEDPTPTVRRAAAGAIRVRAARQPDAVKPLLADALDAAISPELAELVAELLPDIASQLLDDLGSEDERTQGRAIAVLAALAHHDDALIERITQALTQPNLRARAAAAEILQRLGAPPQEPDLAIAYHLACGQIDAIRPLGAAALPALQAACPLYGWRTAGPVAILMLKLGLDPDDALLDETERALADAVALPDDALVRTIGPPAKSGMERRALQFTIPREEDRQTAQELLFRLQRLRERLRQARASAETQDMKSSPKARSKRGGARPLSSPPAGDGGD